MENASLLMAMADASSRGVVATGPRHGCTDGAGAQVTSSFSSPVYVNCPGA